MFSVNTGIGRQSFHVLIQLVFAKADRAVNILFLNLIKAEYFRALLFYIILHYDKDNPIIDSRRP